jgi:hypothetical protein
VQTMAGRFAAKLPRDPGMELRVLRLAVIGLPASLLLGALGSAAPGVGTVLPLGVLVVQALVVVYVRRLPRMIISGVVGGGVAGLIALGGGSRLAMRVVALLGGRRELTIDGTAFLLIGGTVMGAIIGISIALALRLWPSSGRNIGLTIGTLLFGLMLVDGEARTEILHEGPGVWLNAPMFLGFFLGYGAMSAPLVERIERKVPRWTPRFARPAGRLVPPPSWLRLSSRHPAARVNGRMER